MAAWPAPIWIDRVDPNPNLQTGQMDKDGLMDRYRWAWMSMTHCNYLISLSDCHCAAVGVLIGEIGTYYMSRSSCVAACLLVEPADSHARFFQWPSNNTKKEDVVFPGQGN